MDGARGVLACAIVVLLTSVGARAHAYTLKTTPTGATVRWHRSGLELEVMNVGGAAGLSQSEVAGALRRAASAWAAVPGTPELTIREGDRSTWDLDGVNGVYVLEEWPFPNRRLAVTVSRYAEATGELIETDVLINGEMPLAVLEGEHDAGSYDLDLVLTHELGHVLGLDESEVSDATMWHHIGPGETHRRELALDDVDGVLALYGGESAPPIAAGCSAAPRGRSPMALLSIVLAVGVRARRRRAQP